MVEAIVGLEAWDRSESRTFNRVPKSARSVSVSDFFSDEEFEIWRADHMRQAEERLEWLCSREKKRRGEMAVEKADLEQKYTRVLHAIRRKAKLSKEARRFIGIFNDEQGRALFSLLDEIEEQIPWRGFSSQTAHDLIHKRKLLGERALQDGRGP
jgi:hypothetical protein